MTLERGAEPGRDLGSHFEMSTIICSSVKELLEES